MAQCVFQDPRSQKRCERQALPDPQAQGYCILHAPWDEKDLNAFQAAIEEIIQEAPNNRNTCDFSGCYFPREYDCGNLRKALQFNCFFIRATFSGEARFSGAEFSGKADFEEATFSGVADFGNATFSRSAGFSGATFSKYAVFWGATFSGGADFKKATFSRGAGFAKAIFSEKADFGGGATFSGEADFREATFSRYTGFWRATFSEKVDFQQAIFSEEADFREATFSGDTDFKGATFSGNAFFRGATFMQHADFSYAKTDEDSVIAFRSVNCLKPQQVRFHHVDLSHWSFLDTDLHRIDFDDVTWASIRRFLSRRTALFDELTVSNEKDDLARVERLYRHLKQNYENQRDYGRAGDFYYGEMEMKRRQLHPIAQIPFWLYRLMSGYGESYVRALVVLIAMWLTFALLFTVIGYSDPTTNEAPSFAKSLIYSAQSMTLFHEPNITFHSVWGQAIELVASILGVIQIALFGLALQRRFKR